MKRTSRCHSASRPIRPAAIALAMMLAAATVTSCRTSPSGEARSAASECDAEAPGTLRIANSSGRTLDVYVKRADAPPQFLTQVMPGSTASPVPGPADLGARYDIVDPNARRLLASVTWMRRTAREMRNGVMLELTCTPNTPPPAGPGS